MTTQRHVLESFLEDDYSLIAIHCQEEDYNLAFLLNKYLNLNLKKKANNLDINHKGAPISFPLFEYVDEKSHSTIYLLGNTYKSKNQKITSAGSLFEEHYEEKTYFLIPEFKKINFLIKICSDNPKYIEKKLLAEILKLPLVITAYALDYTTLKSNQNLNFN
ncbi:MAG: IPExxxVDY family protein [Flavobacteriaceae bacterium CG_4_8_14_3_um_filter_34_10]|nr:IPExxxVDY family protein [Flavobacteriia bacterium]OIP50684.1 MAG: hypothetical protein AUK33_06940 [Flavobacteriaceae bacterium CG2_30_34_30]PIQ18121.1 MAG: hypothetical protein COW66_08255 [Flavobacteriaceae bacterium CG18_big_fil_WC_8_21_14_2_50_34_36]PIV51300.1 MAG: IPExxxVDY family protein [Flavobacteriaceae bacterium CG02_land_8_20_14_3_00_34_13]PIX10253.1 MAG: IPExxxVDY family protein [Flavobacteriaceae bacterium CG_4_8_14_3_um_filter_34_10]PIZ08570.1 MAG: IPExxxVDY family protein [F